ncbi:MAG TPA: carboxypeptidase-like regulatory domain-containing protein, partial [Thermoanaerobaculia bacterium]
MRRTSTFVFFASASFCTMLAAGPALSGEIRGRVLTDDRPVPGVAVVAVPWETPFEEARREARREVLPSPIASVTTGADGVFALSVNGGAPAREFRVRLEGGSIVTALVPGTFDAQETEDLGDLAVVKGARLAGRLETEQGTPVAGAEVLLFPSRGTGGGLEPTIQKTKSGPDGAFRFDLALPDRNEVSVRVDGLWIQPLSNVRTGAIASPMIARAAGSIVGTIRRSDRQTPAGGVLVRFEALGKTRWVETGADGSFVLKEVPAGTGTLLADGGDAGFAEILGARASANPVTANLTPGARLEGRVVNAVNGKPVPRAKVTALGPRGLLSTRSGADGRYLLRNFVPGRFQVRGDEPRYTPWEKSGVVVRAGEIRKLDLPLTPGVSISGKVVDETGAPVAGAKGSLSPATQTGIRSFLRGLAGQEETAFVSGSNGAFRASRLRSGDNLRLTVNHPSYEAGALAGLKLLPGTVRSGLTVVLRQGMVLSGIVKDEKQEGVPGAEVTLTEARSFGNARGGMMLNMAGPMAGRPENEKTGGDGSFTFRGLSPGDYQVQVRRSGYATETVAPIKLVRGEVPKPVEVFLAPGAAIAGSVKLKDGTPLAGRIIMTRPPGGRGGLALSGGQQPTGPDGLFVLDGLKPGQSYDLLLVEPSAMPRVVRSGVSAPADGIEVLLPAPGRITGSAIDAASGKPVVDFQVWYDTDRSTGQGGGGQVIRMVVRGAAQQLGIGAGEKVVVHAEDGSFALENVPPGNWEVNVEALGYQTARVGGVTVSEGSERPGITVKVSPGVTLTGKVVDAQSGRGIPNAVVAKSAAGAPGGAIRIGLPQADDSGQTTDADGAFQMDGIAPGKYSITAKHPDFTDGSEAVDVKETGAAVKIALSAGSHISGIVVDAANQPLAGAQVALVAASDAGPMGRGGIASEGTTTDQSGSFRFDHLAAGRYTVTASLRNASSSQQQVVLPSGQSQDGVVISLAAGATVQGVVTGLPAEKRGNVLISASGADGFGNSVRSAADGSFQISGAPEGILMLRATAGDLLTSSQTKTTEVQIPAGQTLVNAEIAFDPTGAAIAGSVTRGGQLVSGGAVMINARGGAGLAYS